MTRGLVGNTWQGLQLSIRQGNMSITALAHIITQLAAHGGERKLFERGLLPAVWRLDCQDERRAQWHAPRDGPYGNALTTFPTERVPKEARSEAITYEPVLDYAWCHFGRDLANPAMHLPFRYLLWDFLVRVARGGGNGEQGLGIWPELPQRKWRWKRAWAWSGGRSLEYLRQKIVPAADHTCWENSSPGSSFDRYRYYGPCPRTKAGDEIYNGSRLVSGLRKDDAYNGSYVVVPVECWKDEAHNGSYGSCPASSAPTTGTFLISF